MAKRKPTNKYYFSVEGETEQWYLKWLQDAINNTEEASCKVSIDCPVRKNPLKHAKSLTVTRKIEIYHFFDYESDEPIHVKGFQEALDNMKKADLKGFINATDCADYLTKKGMPFRDAYKLTGCMVSDCIAADKTLEELTLTQFQTYSPLFGADIYDAIDLVHCCEGRTSYGGPSAASVEKQIALATARLDAWEEENA